MIRLRLLPYLTFALLAGVMCPHATRADESDHSSRYSEEDPDGDNLTNDQEAFYGTYPYNAYSDADAKNDGEDGWALDSDLAPPRVPDTGYAMIDLSSYGIWPQAVSDNLTVLYWDDVNNTSGLLSLTTGKHALPFSLYTSISKNGRVLGSDNRYAFLDAAGTLHVSTLPPAGSGPAASIWTATISDTLVVGGGSWGGGGSPNPYFEATLKWGNPNPLGDVAQYEHVDGYPDYWLVTSGVQYYAARINESGAIAGHRAFFSAGEAGGTWSQPEAGVFSGANFIVLPNFTGMDFSDMNDAHHIAILGYMPQIADEYPHLWIQTPAGFVEKPMGAWHPPVNAQNLHAVINHINDRYEMVGDIYRGNGGEKAELIRNSRIVDLKVNGVDVDANWINNHGVITGGGVFNGVYKPALLVPCDIAVDANRDGVIKFAGNYNSTATNLVGKPQDKTSEDKPFRFWCNDDLDQNDEEHPDSNIKDSANNQIEGLRDLEDFSRLHLYLGGLQDAVANGTIKVGLEWRNTTGNPSIKVYRAAEPNGGSKYLTDENSYYAAYLQTAVPFNTALGTIDGSGGFKFPLDFWQSTGSGIPAFDANHPTRYLIFEGVTEGKGQLVMTFWKGNQKIGEGGGTWLDLVNVRKMYERAKATPDSIAKPQDSTTTPATPSVSYVLDPNGHQWEYPATSWTESKDYIIFVHGWKTSYNSARTYFAETMFKRLWQRGYKGRFAALYWPTLTGLDSYNESEYRAWFFGESLKQYVNSLPSGYTKHLMAHSMGNIVAGSALRKGMSVADYAMIDAAVPASCYDDSPSLHKSFGLNSPDHDTDQSTLALAYKNKLASVNINLINFYLASDDALELWQTNQEIYRPQIFYNINQNYHGDGYYSWNSSGQKLFLSFVISNTRYLQQMEESLSYAAKSSTLAVGAEGNTGGSVSGAINLGGAGYENEHSSFWEFTLQKMKTRYDSLMDELHVQRIQE